MKPEYLIPILGYFLGSIPFGYVLVKTTTGADIRKAGSGNIGATNVFRKSRAIGILTFLMDAGKGYLAVVAAGWLGGDVRWQAAAAVASILGHVFTVFLGFKGGKGVAVGFGAYLALTPAAAGTTMIVFLLTTALTRYVSLASILATAAYPLWVYLYHKPSIVFWSAVIGSALIVAKHHQNIRRLLSGKEHKFALGDRSG
ncbi:MAG: glycerol-3-phosphate 1-O-acyltransferase PlsY [Acidobacteriia bacterium]|nr:glycerol-3-phosphate 1-O-acyltransferase PlsY [Terriglobia bacterium]